MEHVSVLGDHADDAMDRVEGGVTHVDAIDADRARTHVVEPGDEMADRGLAGSGRTDQRHQLARLDRERHVEEHLLGRGLAEDRDGLERCQRHLLGSRVAEVDVVEFDRRGSTRDGDRGRLLGDRGLQIEHLEDAVEGDQRSHDVDLHVRERREGTVQTVQIGRQGHEGADLEGA